MVTTTDDHDDGTCEATDCSLREAFDLASTDGVASEIVLSSAATFDLTLCAEGDLDHAADENLTITANGATLQQTCAGWRVIDHDGEGLVALQDVTLTGGNVDAAGGDGSGGGAIRVQDDGSLEVTGSTITGNATGDGGSGGGIDILFTTGAATITNSTISGNTASDTGGIRNASGDVIVTDSTISGNSATLGGGVDAGGTLTVRNSTVADNEAREDFGGGVASDDPVEVTGSTIVDNTAVTGGANVDHDDGELTTTGSIIAKGHGAPDCGGPGQRTSGGFNVGGDTSCGFDEPTDVQGVGNPLLGPLTDNGGAQLTRVPLAGSPARDRVPNTDCTGADSPVFSPDERGVGRPQPSGGDDCDSGAVEADVADTQADGLVKIAGEGGLVGAGIFNTTGDGQKKSAKRLPGEKVKFVVKARNAAPLVADTLTVTAPADDPQFKTTYTVDSDDVTTEVNGAGYDTGALAAGDDGKLKVKVKVKGSTSLGAKQKLFVTATDSSGIRSDTVKLVTKAK